MRIEANGLPLIVNPISDFQPHPLVDVCRYIAAKTQLELNLAAREREGMMQLLSLCVWKKIITKELRHHDRKTNMNFTEQVFKLMPFVYTIKESY